MFSEYNIKSHQKGNEIEDSVLRESDWRQDRCSEVAGTESALEQATSRHSRRRAAEVSACW